MNIHPMITTKANKVSLTSNSLENNQGDLGKIKSVLFYEEIT